ncbi:MAG: PAS sensor protein [Prevotellaceae bacterium]|jgi:DUF438 domain-containing protein|nr:PAS sensor protein [Prevotellaceae bacterium]
MNYFENQDIAITVCDYKANVVYQNAKSKEIFTDVAGRSLYECHPAHAAAKIDKMLSDGEPNAYTIINKAGAKKMIYQNAWRDSEGNIKGLIEYSFVIPDEMAHFDRRK